MNGNTANTISALMLERYHLGEVTPEEKAALEARLAADEGLARRLAGLERQDAEIREHYPAQERGARHHDSARHHDRHSDGARHHRPHSGVWHPRPRRLVYGISAGIAAALLIAAGLPFLGPRLQGGGGSFNERVKGVAPPHGGAQAELAVYLKRETGAAAVSSGDTAKTFTVHAGDTVQLAYTVSDPSQQYGVIFSIDGRAAVTLHYPYTADGDTALLSGKQAYLDEAYTLDDAPDFEAFFMVVSDAPLSPSAVLRKAGEIAETPDAMTARSAETFRDYEVKSVIIYKSE
jgi:anti-sigma-K factor RskA